MRYTQAEKLEIIRLVEESDLPAKRTLIQLGVAKSCELRIVLNLVLDGVGATEILTAFGVGGDGRHSS